MTEQELMKTKCPHFAMTVAPVACYCIGSACSQYRERIETQLPENHCTVPDDGLWNSDDTNPDSNIWRYTFVSNSKIYYTRIIPLTNTHAWCGLAGVPLNVGT